MKEEVAKESAKTEIKPPNPVQSRHNTGLGSLQSTTAFRALNFELYAKPNKFGMGFGLIAITGCVAYLAYLNATAENRKEGLYEVYNPDGTLRSTERKTSRWD